MYMTRGDVTEIEQDGDASFALTAFVSWPKESTVCHASPPPHRRIQAQALWSLILLELDCSCSAPVAPTLFLLDPDPSIHIDTHPPFLDIHTSLK